MRPHDDLECGNASCRCLIVKRQRRLASLHSTGCGEIVLLRGKGEPFTTESTERTEALRAAIRSLWAATRPHGIWSAATPVAAVFIVKRQRRLASPHSTGCGEIVPLRGKREPFTTESTESTEALRAAIRSLWAATCPHDDLECGNASCRCLIVKRQRRLASPHSAGCGEIVLLRGKREPFTTESTESTESTEALRAAIRSLLAATRPHDDLGHLDREETAATRVSALHRMW
jgi:hypothetical protein